MNQDVTTVTPTMTAEELEKKKNENIINTFVTSCSISMKESTKTIALLDNSKELFLSLGFNLGQVKSLLSGIHYMNPYLLLLSINFVSTKSNRSNFESPNRSSSNSFDMMLLTI